MVNLSDVVKLELRPDCEEPGCKNFWVESSKQNNEHVSKTGTSLVGCMWVKDQKNEKKRDVQILEEVGKRWLKEIL